MVGTTQGFLPQFCWGSTGGAGEGVGSTQGSLPQLCWGSTGEAGEGVGAPDVGVSRVRRPPTRQRVPSPIASLWGTDPVSTGGAWGGVGSPQGSLPRLRLRSL